MCEKHHGSFLVGLIMGAVTGLAAALYLHSPAGENTKKWLSKKKEENQEFINNINDTAEELVDKAKNSIEESIKSLTKTIDEKVTKKFGKG